jgi:membrane protein
VVGVVVWLLATAAFNFYVTSFGSYGATYGTLAGLIVFLLWLWILNVALLSSAEFNAELELARERAAGEEPKEAPRLPLRHVGGRKKRHGADPAFHKDMEKRPAASTDGAAAAVATREARGARRGSSSATLAANLLLLLVGLWALRLLGTDGSRRPRHESGSALRTTRRRR